MLSAGWKFSTPDGKAHFGPVTPPARQVPEGAFLVTTRRGRQFNSMVQAGRDEHTGADRGSVLINGADALALGIDNGSSVILRSESGELAGTALIAPVTPGTLQVHWPEGEVLIDRKSRSPSSGIPDYTAVVRVEVAAQAQIVDLRVE